VLSALGPNMLALARDHADGTHPFSVPVEHTALARKVLGPDKLLIPEQAVFLEPDPAHARATARAYLAAGSAHSAYRRNWRRLGYSDAEFAEGGTDRLVDARLAWGDEAAVARRLGEHLDAGADSVLVHPLARDVTGAVDQLAVLAPALAAGM
jgi:probable F420-dependent oxidoreductase